jgi:hypothetical protein
MITGAELEDGKERTSSDIGIDMLCDDGRPITIPWSDLGVTVLHNHNTGRATSQHDKQRTTQSTLQLPTDLTRFVARSNRRSGLLSTVTSENDYRLWLQQWWPTGDTQPFTLCVADEFNVARVNWLRQQRRIDNLKVRRHNDLIDSEIDSGLKIFIGEDDRFLRVYSRRGRQLETEWLVNWINGTHRTVAQHITAHASHDNQQILLYDVVSPNSGAAQRVICDGLALAGFLLTLSAKNDFPV